MHKQTSDFIELIYSYGVFPLICKPTRVTKDTATLIDHILTNNFDMQSHHKQGILCSSISDHFSTFHIAGKTPLSSENNDQSPPLLLRNFSQRNINRFITEMSNVDWQPIIDLNDARDSYANFQNKISKLYDICFPLTKTKKKYFNNKPWLTSALKESIKRKNKLYVNRNKGQNPHEKDIFYKQYRNRLNHVLKSAERKYLCDLIIQHKSNIKKNMANYESCYK